MSTNEAGDSSIKSKRPSDSAFKQQRLPAWQPILTAGTVLPTFFVIGIAFIPVGIGLLYFSDEVQESVTDYTHCLSMDSNRTCADIIKENHLANCTCELEVNLTHEFKGDVYVYYGLANYYQNHRRYVKSRDDSQLLGHLSDTPSSDCDPFTFSSDKGVKKPIAPCGAIANSLFSDKFELTARETGKKVMFIKKGIAWESDRNIKFKNPPLVNGSLKEAFKDFEKPAAWRKHIWELDTENENNNGFENEDFIVWMRTAALPTFRKLYAMVNHSVPTFSGGLLPGIYILSINYSYNVIDFDGKKSFILSTTSLLGGKNPFLGVAYIVVGCICLVLGIALLIIHVKCSKSTTEMINVNPRTPYS